MRISETLTLIQIPEIIERQVRKEKGIIIGGQAIKAHLDFYARPSFDYDILTSQPEPSARKLERTLDNKSGGNHFFRKPAKGHPSTIKVVYVGEDRRRNTPDDQTIADFSPIRATRTTSINGIRYAQISSIVQEKRQILQQKELSYRHAKDRDDINLIKQVTALRRGR